MSTIKDNAEDKHFTRKRPELWKQPHSVLAGDKIVPSKRMRNSLMLIASGGEEGSLHWVTKVLLPARLNTEIASIGTALSF